MSAFRLCRAQSSKDEDRRHSKPLSPGDAKKIDIRLEKLQETFATESTAIIDDYEKSGQFERAKFLLEVLLKLDPKERRLLRSGFPTSMNAFCGRVEL